MSTRSIVKNGSPVLGLAAAALMAALAGMPAAAQPVRGGAANPVATEQVNKDPLVSVDFKGGTVQEYIAVLRKAMDRDPVNAVVSDSAARAQLAGITLRGVSLSTAMQAISAAAGDASGSWSISPIPSRSNSPEAAMAFAVDYQSRGAVRPNDVAIETYSLSRLIHPGKDSGPGIPATVVMTAIETGLRMQGADEHVPELKFHEDSGLLFVRGTPAEVRLVGAVVARMSDDMERNAKASSRLAQAERERAMAIREAELNIQMRETELQQALMVVEETEQLVKAGNAPTPELSAAKSQVRKAQIRLEEAKLGRERAAMVGMSDARGSSGDSAVRVEASRDELLAQIAAMQKRINDLEAAQKAGAPKGGSQTR